MDRFFKKKQAQQLKQEAVKPATKEASAKAAGALEAVSAPVAGGSVRRGTALSARIIIRPLVTEKSSRLTTAGRKYAFVVARSAKKIQIKQAVQEMYGTEPTAVNVLNVQGRRVRFGRALGRRADFKKAIVTLKPGEVIAIHEGV